MIKHKHHIIPAIYLSGFTDSAGKLYEYRAEDTLNPRYNIPRELGHRRDYYAQPLEDGGTDYNTLEDFFSILEGKWPILLKKLEERESLEPIDIQILYQFISMLKVRVPAMREGVEYFLSSMIRMTAKGLENSGELPPRPEGLKDLTWSDFKISVDPHQSIHAMSHLIEGFGAVLDSVNFVIYRNNTKTSFLTSDNPVVYFDPTFIEKEMKPYALNPVERQVEFIFPLSSKLILHGHSSYNESKFSYKKIKNELQVRRFNRLICRFSYERTYSQNKSHEALIKKYSLTSPVLETEELSTTDGSIVLPRFVFSERRVLPKWKKDRS